MVKSSARRADGGGIVPRRCAFRCIRRIMRMSDATELGASSCSQTQPSDDIAGHGHVAARGAPHATEGRRAAAQVAPVHAFRGMMHLMQLRLLARRVMNACRSVGGPTGLL